MMLERLVLSFFEKYQRFLEEHLQRDDVLASLLAREVDVPKLAPTERFADVEVAQLRARVGRVGECGQDDGVAGRGGERAAHSR